MDPRYAKLANVLCRYSMELNKSDKLLIDASDTPDEFVVAVIREARACGATVWARTNRTVVTRELLKNGTPAQHEGTLKWDLPQVKDLTAYCAIRGFENLFEQSDVPLDNYAEAMKILKPIQNQRVNHTKWVLIRWPTKAMAHMAKMSTEAFADYYFNVCTLDYKKMVPGALALKKLMEKTDKVHIKGPNGTDLRFSIKGIGAEECVGSRNIPDGEVYSCPIKDSVEGVVQYNTPTVYPTNGGKEYTDIRLEFKKGKIVKASCASGDPKELNKILDSDAGARYIGEFAIGFNPHVTSAICDILFDEKIAGSFHFTPGNAYETAGNGNKSQVHWDLVCIQRPEYGGGEIWFDGKLIRKDGLFVTKELEQLNPKNLLKK